MVSPTPRGQRFSALAATAGAWFCRRRPAVVHVLWLLVLIKLVTPSLVRVELPAGEGEEIARSGRARDGVMGGRAIRWWGLHGKARGRAGRLRFPERHSSTVAREPHATTASRLEHWRPAIFSLWFAGALAWLVYVATSAVRFRRLISSAPPASRELTDRASEVAAKLGLHSLPKISFVRAHVPPMLWASLVGRPRCFARGTLDSF